MYIFRNACFSDFRESNKDATMLHQLCYMTLSHLSDLIPLAYQGWSGPVCKDLKSFPPLFPIQSLSERSTAMGPRSLHALNESRRDNPSGDKPPEMTRLAKTFFGESIFY